MKTSYKIYHSAISKNPNISGYAWARPIHSPDFQSETEAENWLEEKIINADSEVSKMIRQENYYYFIQKTYIQE